MDMMNKNVIGIILVCLGLALVFPMMPKIIIIVLGFYLIMLGVRLLTSNKKNY
jgi:uncharacterized membrane protein